MAQPTTSFTGEWAGSMVALRREAGTRLDGQIRPPGHQQTTPVLAITGSEMYGEYFSMLQPDEFTFISSFSKCGVFRSGCCVSRASAAFPIFSQQQIRGN